MNQDRTCYIAYIKQFCLRISDTLLATFNQDFVRLGCFPGLAFTVLARIAGESNLDIVLFLQPNDVFSVLTDQR